ncbi:hypothetical protein MRX96_037640 [Rhipicephalus microplus]
MSELYGTRMHLRLCRGTLTVAHALDDVTDLFVSSLTAGHVMMTKARGVRVEHVGAHSLVLCTPTRHVPLNDRSRRGLALALESTEVVQLPKDLAQKEKNAATP